MRGKKKKKGKEKVKEKKKKKKNKTKKNRKKKRKKTQRKTRRTRRHGGGAARNQGRTRARTSPTKPTPQSGGEETRLIKMSVSGGWKKRGCLASAALGWRVTRGGAEGVAAQGANHAAGAGRNNAPPPPRPGEQGGPPPNARDRGGKAPGGRKTERAPGIPENRGRHSRITRSELDGTTS